MSTASNRLFIQALEDGTTLHATIQSTKPLTQAWTGNAAVPDWSIDDNRPIIYVTLQSGSQYVTPDGVGTWKYNNTILTFDINGVSQAPYADLFQKVNYTPSGYSTTVPALKIINNLATSGNVNTDTIEYVGSYTPSGATSSEALPISVSTNINITQVQSGGIFGLIYFANGKSTITQDDEELVLTGKLFDDSGSEITTYSTSWKINNESKSDDTGHAHQLTITENDIVDNAIVECIFTTTIEGATQTFSAFESVDDQQDEDVMYIQYDDANGNAASLRKGGTVTFYMWMGKMSDPTILTEWDTWKIRLHRGDGEVVTSNQLHIDGEPDIPNADANGLRTLNMSNNKAYFGAGYTQVKTFFQGYLTGYIFASTSA